MLPDETESSDNLGVSNKKFKCDVQDCNLEFLKASALKYHMNVHSNLRPFKCAYLNCDKAYFSPSHLQRHSLIHNNGFQLERQKCKECSASFTNSGNLKRHMKRKHDESNRKNFCAQCNKQFGKRYLYEEHEEMFHNLMGHRLKSYECEQCGHVLKNLRSFKRHKRDHLTKYYTCSEEKCSAVFLTKALLHEHTQSSHINEFSCADCNQCFNSKTQLRKHVVSHLENGKSYPCPYNECYRIYTRKSNLKMHIRCYHTKEVTFQCTVCQLYLSTKQRLNQHKDNFHKLDTGIG